MNIRKHLPIEKISNHASVAATIGPGLILLLLFLLIPILFLIVISFARIGDSYNIIYQFSIDNYADILIGSSGFFQTPFTSTLITTLIIAAMTTLITILLSFPVSYALSRMNTRSFRLTLFFILLPFFTIYIVRIYAWYTLFGQSSVINTTLMTIGIVSDPISLFNYGMFPVIVGLTHAYFPYMLLTLYASLDGINHSLIEASRDLGANRLEVLKDIILPLSASGIVSGSVFVFIPALGAFVTPKFLAQGKITMVGEIIATRINSIYAIGFGSAAAIFIIIPTLVAFVIILQYVNFEEIAGA